VNARQRNAVFTLLLRLLIGGKTLANSKVGGKEQFIWRATQVQEYSFCPVLLFFFSCNRPTKSLSVRAVEEHNWWQILEAQGLYKECVSVLCHVCETVATGHWETRESEEMNRRVRPHFRTQEEKNRLVGVFNDLESEASDALLCTGIVSALGLGFSLIGSSVDGRA